MISYNIELYNMKLYHIKLCLRYDTQVLKSLNIGFHNQEDRINILFI